MFSGKFSGHLWIRAPRTRQVLNETVTVSLCHGRDETRQDGLFRRSWQSETWQNRDKVRRDETVTNAVRGALTLKKENWLLYKIIEKMLFIHLKMTLRTTLILRNWYMISNFFWSHKKEQTLKTIRIQKKFCLLCRRWDICVGKKLVFMKNIFDFTL